MTVYNPQRDTPPFLRECHQDTGPRRAPSEDVMHGPRLQSLPVAEWLALTQLNGATSPTAPTAPCTASTAPTAPTAPYAPVSPGLPDYRTAHRSSSSELRELESELREIELRVASLSADSGGGRRRDAGPPQSPQGKSISAFDICNGRGAAAVHAPHAYSLRHSPRTLSHSRLVLGPSLPPRPLGTGSAWRAQRSLGCCCSRRRRGPCGSLGASEC